MPTYEYRCPSCGQEFEQFQRMSDEPVLPCPECGSASERLISAGAGLLFKGEGFYITDNRPDSYKKSAEKEVPSADSKAGSKDESGKADGGKTSSKSAESSGGGE